MSTPKMSNFRLFYQRTRVVFISVMLCCSISVAFDQAHKKNKEGEASSSNSSSSRRLTEIQNKHKMYGE